MKMHASLALAATLALACSDPARSSAQQALEAAEGAVAGLGEVAARYEPEQTQAVKRSLAEAQALLASKDYKRAQAAAVAVQARAKDLAILAAAKEDDARKWKEVQGKRWKALSGLVRRELEELNQQLESLSAAAQLPHGVTPAAVQQARIDAAAMSEALGAAQGLADHGDLDAAVGRVTELRGQVAEVLATVGAPR